MTTRLRPTSLLQHEAWRSGRLPPVEEVREGIFAIPVPMADNPLRYSYCYALLDGTDALLIDPGWPTDESWGMLRAGLARIGSDVDHVRAILVTHAHFDHYGLAPRILAASQAWVGLGEADLADLVPRGANYAEILERRRQWLLREGGAAEDDADRSAGDLKAIAFAAVEQLPDRTLSGGEVFSHGRFEIEAVATPGHSPGHLVFHERTERLLFSGDHVLPRITPNISAFAGHSGTALSDFLVSLDRVRGLDVGEVLPGHEYRFAGLDDRVDQIVEHHERRLAEVRAGLGEGEVSAWRLSQGLRWSRPWEQFSAFSRRAAVGEILAHLRVLERRGLVDLGEDENGAWSWRTAGEAKRGVAAGS